MVGELRLESEKKLCSACARTPVLLLDCGKHPVRPKRGTQPMHPRMRIDNEQLSSPQQRAQGALRLTQHGPGGPGNPWLSPARQRSAIGVLWGKHQHLETEDQDGAHAQTTGGAGGAAGGST